MKEHNEIWRAVPDFSAYEVSNLGQVRRVIGSRGKPPIGVLQPWSHPHGYVCVNLYHNGQRFAYTVHKLIALAFLGPRPEGHEVNHKDGDKRNNAITNLEYVTPSENHIHAARTGLGYAGALNGQAKLGAIQVEEIKSLCKQGISQKRVAAHFGISQGHVSDIVTGKKWAYG